MLLYMFIGTFAVIVLVGLMISLAQFINDFSREHDDLAKINQFLCEFLLCL